VHRKRRAFLGRLLKEFGVVQDDVGTDQLRSNFKKAFVHQRSHPCGGVLLDVVGVNDDCLAADAFHFRPRPARVDFFV
jgi:hypothetical protein